MRWTRFLAAAALAVVAATAPPSAAGAATDGTADYGRRLLAKAVPDECFAGIGLPYPAGPPCATGQAKVNQAYVWGMARTGARLWFGTGANVHCLVTGASLGAPEPVANDDWTCEYGKSQLAQRVPDLPDALGDVRTPQVFVYDLSCRALTERTADILAASEVDARRLRSTLGMRAAGTHQGVVLLGGPNLQGGISLFAFDTASGDYLGSTTLPAYDNIRRFVVVGGAMYAGVGGVDGVGHVLRWTGNRAAPFSFLEVADVRGEAAELVAHQGRIYVSTWPDQPQTTPPTAPAIAGLWVSPPLADGEPGLTPADAAGWRQVWSVAQYEPDPLVETTVGGGALASYGGFLYWGTMHVPMRGTVAHLRAFPPRNDEQGRATIASTQRGVAIFRGKNLAGQQPKIELLYGESQLPAYDPRAQGGLGAWAPAPTGYTPRFGPGGFGNVFTNYTWTMTVTRGTLYVGTMDWSAVAANTTLPGRGRIFNPDPAGFGAELWAFRHPDRPAAPVDTTGLGNPLNYGIRTMLAYGPNLYLGMANPMNLRADPADGAHQGGWELIELPTR